MQKFQGYGLLLLRLLIAARLIYGVQDNIFSWERMVEFEHFLAKHGVPYPVLGAVVSVYVQFICGVLVLLGAFIRWASIPLIINFIAALFIAHRGDTLVGMFQALTILITGFVFLFEGAGKLSIDERLSKRRS
ncbi:DoxX family protein [bacterium]|nr:DoxX family protein [bacterium]MCI0607178.1 DoxX family protein [bacterium]